MGLIVPRYRFSAVARNRLRRQLREAWRREGRARAGEYDLIIRARREAYAAGFGELQAQVVGWAKGKSEERVSRDGNQEQVP